MARSRPIVDLQFQLDDVAKFIGSFQGWEDSIDTPYHMDSLLTYAHAMTTREFNEEAALAAQSGYGISHMYEWGTAGINPAKGSPVLKPTSREARLWTHRLSGRGAHKGIDFGFNVSKMPVPLNPKLSMKKKPTDQHFFTLKASITEFGDQVTVKAKKPNGVLLIPLDAPTTETYERVHSARDKARGFTFTRKTVHLIPGRTNAGNFSSFWFGWWNTIGSAAIAAHSKKAVDGDAEAVLYKGRGTAKGIKTYAKGSQSKAFSLKVSQEKAKASAAAKARQYARDREAEVILSEEDDL